MKPLEKYRAELRKPFTKGDALLLLLGLLIGGVLFSITACEGPSALEIDAPKPPDVRIQSAMIDHRKSGTVVDNILKNDGGAGVFKLTFWATEDGGIWVARETASRFISWDEEVQYYWAITRDGTHIELDSLQAWSAFTETETWALTDSFIFD